MIPANAQKLVEQALSSKNPSLALFNLCCELRDDGVTQKEMYGYFIHLSQQFSEDEIYDTLDLIAGTCSNSNWWVFPTKLENEP